MMRNCPSLTQLLTRRAADAPARYIRHDTLGPQRPRRASSAVSSFRPRIKRHRRHHPRPAVLRREPRVFMRCCPHLHHPTRWQSCILRFCTVTPWRRCATPCDNVGVVSYMSSPVRSFSFLPFASRVSMLPALATPHPPTPRRVQTKQRRVRAVVPSAHHLFPLSSRASAPFSGCPTSRGIWTLFSLRSSSSVLPGATSSRRPPSCSTEQPLANRGIRGAILRSFSVWSRL
jgi:hypothetical protein